MGHWLKGLTQVAWSHTTTFDRNDHNNLPLIGGLSLVQWTLTTRGLRICPLLENFVSCNGLRPSRASRSAPHRRTLSRERTLAKTDRARTTKQDEPKRTMPILQTKRLGKQKEQTVQYLPGKGGRFCVGHLVDAMMVIFACWQSSSGSMKKLSAKTNDQSERDLLILRRIQWEAVCSRLSYLFDRFELENVRLW
jgi:hypothetical protein